MARARANDADAVQAVLKQHLCPGLKYTEDFKKGKVDRAFDVWLLLGCTVFFTPHPPLPPLPFLTAFRYPEKYKMDTKRP